MDSLERISQLETKLAALQAEHDAMLIAVTSLITVAPNQRAFHLSLATAFEAGANRETGSLKRLTDAQLEGARELVEHWGSLPNIFPKPPVRGAQ